LTHRKARSGIAMTGEITLRGQVLRVGGIKEKVLGAHRAGIRTVILPKDNQGDLEDVPVAVRSAMIFAPVERIDHVLTLALEPAAGNALTGNGAEVEPESQPQPQPMAARAARQAANAAPRPSQP